MWRYVGIDEVMDKKFDDELRRLRSLAASMECLLVCASDLEDPSQPIASSIFLLTDMKESIERLESAASGSITAPAND